MWVAVVDDESSFAGKVKEGIEKNQKCYDLYLLDVEMPGINGIMLAEKVRTFDYNAKIVFLTAYENYARHGYKVKAYDYLLFPFWGGKMSVPEKTVTREGTTIELPEKMQVKNAFMTVYQDGIYYKQKSGRFLLGMNTFISQKIIITIPLKQRN